MIVAGLISAAVGALVALPALRLGGIFLSLATFAFALFFDCVMVKLTWVSGGDGVIPNAVPRPLIGSIDFDNEKAFLVLCMVVLLVVGLLVVVGAARHDRTVPRRAARQRDRGRVGRHQPDPLAHHRVRALGRHRRGRRRAARDARRVRRLRHELPRPTRVGVGRGGRVARIPHRRRRDPGWNRLHLLPAGRARGLDTVDLQPRVRRGRPDPRCDHHAPVGHPQVRGGGCGRRDRGGVACALLPDRRSGLGGRQRAHRPRHGLLRPRCDHVRAAPRRDARAQQAACRSRARSSGSIVGRHGAAARRLRSRPPPCAAFGRRARRSARSEPARRVGRHDDVRGHHRARRRQPRRGRARDRRAHRSERRGEDDVLQLPARPVATRRRLDHVRRQGPDAGSDAPPGATRYRPHVPTHRAVRRHVATRALPRRRAGPQRPRRTVEGRDLQARRTDRRTNRTGRRRCSSSSGCTASPTARSSR